MNYLIKIFSKNAFVLCFVLMTLIVKSQNDSILIISDLDDTYKITNSAKIIPAIFNISFTKKSFSGNSELYNLISDDGKNLIILSKTPEIFRKRVEKLMEKDSLTPKKIILKKSSDDSDNYKVLAIKQIIDKNPDYQFILIGDDVSHDHEVYKTIADEYYNKILEIYIRPVKNKDLPNDEIKYTTAFDIALFEYKNGRMELEDVELIGNEILSCKDLRKIKPHFIKNKYSPEFENLPYELQNIFWKIETMKN